MSDTPTTPVPPLPAPDVNVHWSAGRDFAGSLWRWTKSFGEVRVWGACHGAVSGLWWVSSRVWYAAFVLLVAFTCLAYLAQSGWINLPLPIPAPTPVQPTALEQEIRTAYLAETDPAKAVNAAKLASLFAKIVPATRTAGTARTVADLDAIVQAATANAIGKGSMPVVGKAIGTYLDAVLPTTKTTALTDQIWLQAEAEFGRVSAALTKGAK